jgi:hypothetical protein
MPETSKTAMPKPPDVSPLVWAVVLTLDQIEKETPTGLAGFAQKHLAEKVKTKLSRGVSRRTLQNAMAFRRKRIEAH